MYAQRRCEKTLTGRWPSRIPFSRMTFRMPCLMASPSPPPLGSPARVMRANCCAMVSLLLRACSTRPQSLYLKQIGCFDEFYSCNEQSAGMRMMLFRHGSNSRLHCYHPSEALLGSCAPAATPWVYRCSVPAQTRTSS